MLQRKDEGSQGGRRAFMGKKGVQALRGEVRRQHLGQHLLAERVPLLGDRRHVDAVVRLERPLVAALVLELVQRHDHRQRHQPLTHRALYPQEKICAKERGKRLVLEPLCAAVLSPGVGRRVRLARRRRARAHAPVVDVHAAHERTHSGLRRQLSDGVRLRHAAGGGRAHGRGWMAVSKLGQACITTSQPCREHGHAAPGRHGRPASRAVHTEMQHTPTNARAPHTPPLHQSMHSPAHP
eukprot:356175-Chlamydomonas_euryale.AAC.2